MNQKFLFILIVFSIFLVGINSVFAENMENQSEMSTISVGYEDEIVSAGGLSTTANNWASLQAGAEDENVSTIYLNATDIAPSNNSNDQIIFNHDLTIIGSANSYVGHANWSAYSDVSNKYNYIPFLADSNIHLVFENVTFKYLADDILIKVAGNGYYEFRNCVFMNINATASHKAVVWLNAGTALLDNCTFIECDTSYGAVSNYNENSVNLVHMTVKDCTFEDNYANTEPGCINNCGQLVVMNSTFNHNSAFWWAGAIHTHNGASTTIRKSRFIDNVAGWNGGALYTYSTLNVYDSIFIGNNCTTNSGGGAIGVLAYWGQEPPVVVFDNCSFVNNTNNENSTGNGGVISMSGGALTMTNNYFENNSAVNGKAIYASGLSNGVLVNNTFVNHTNTTLGDNTVIFKADSYVIENNSYINSLIDLTTFELNADFSFSTVTTCHLKIVGLGYLDLIKSSSYEVHDGTNVYNISGSNYNELTSTIDFTINTGGIRRDVNVTSDVFNRTSNTIQVPIPAIYVSTTGRDTNDGLTISTPVKTISKAVTLSKNNNIPTIAVASGTYSISSSIGITKNVHLIGSGNVIFDMNSVTANQAFLVSGSKVTCTFENINLINSKKMIIQSIMSNNVLELVNCTVKDNTVTSTYLIRATSLLLEDCTFENNNKYITYSDGDVINSTFINNVGSKGFLYFSGSNKNFNIINSSFIANSGTTGVIYANQFKNANINGCLFVNNTATSASAIYVNSRSTACSLVVEDCVFLNNGVASTIFKSGNYAQTKVTANKNWWGNTAYNCNINLSSVSSGVILDNWLFMNIFADNNPICNNIRNVVVTLNNLLTYRGITYGVNNNLPYIILDVTCINGNADSNNVSLINGVGNINYNPTVEGVGVLTVSYGGISQNITFNNLGYDFTVDVCDIRLGDDEIINITLPSTATGSVSIKIGEYEDSSSLVNGATSFVVSGLSGGQHDVLVTYNGNRRGFNYTTSFNVDSTEITLRYFGKLDYNHNITLNIYLDNVTGDVNVTINGVSNNYTLVNGVVNVILNDDNLVNSGRNNISVYYDGNGSYLPGYAFTYLMFDEGNYSWAMDGHDAKNTGKSSLNGTDDTNLLWKVHFNEIIVGSVIDDDGSIYIATVSSIYKYDSEGYLLWKFSPAGDAEFSGLAISRDVIIAPREGYTIYFINKVTGVQYSLANIWQGSSLFEPVVDDESNIYISGEYQEDYGNYILTVIPYDMWADGGTPIIVNLTSNSLTSAPTVIEDNKTVCIGTTNGLLIVNITSRSYSEITNFGGVISRPVVTNDGFIYFLTDTKLVKTYANGTVINDTSVMGYSLALSDDWIIVVGNNGLYYYNLTTWGMRYNQFNNLSSKILIDANNHIYVGDINGNIYRTLVNGSANVWMNLGSSIIRSFSIANNKLYVWDTNNMFYTIGMEENLSLLPSLFFLRSDELLGLSLDEVISIGDDDLISDSGYEGTFVDFTRILFTGGERDEDDRLIGFEPNSYFVWSDEISSASGDELEQFGLGYYDTLDEDMNYVYPDITLNSETVYIDKIPHYIMYRTFGEWDLQRDWDNYPFLREDAAEHGYDSLYVIDGKNSTLDLKNHAFFFKFIESYDSKYYDVVWLNDNEFTDMVDLLNKKSCLMFENFTFTNLKIPYPNNAHGNGFFIDNLEDFNGEIVFYNCNFVNFTHSSGMDATSYSFFQGDNVKFIDCNFINISTPYYLKNNGFAGVFFLHENVTIQNCTFNNIYATIGIGYLFGLNYDAHYDTNNPKGFFEPHNINIINNTVIASTEYIIPITGWDTSQINFEDNYFISNSNSAGNERYGMDTIKEFSSFIDQYSSLSDYELVSQYGSEYLAEKAYIQQYYLTNYPLQTNITVLVNDTYLTFTLDNVDNGTLTYGDEEVPILNGVGSYSISESPGTEITGSTSYLGDKYYAKSNTFTVTVPKIEPEFTIEASEIIYNQSIPSVTIETDNGPDFNITVWDSANKLAYNTTSKKGNVELKELTAGYYIINVTSIEDTTYASVSKTTPLIIQKASTEITDTVVNGNNLVITLNNTLVSGVASVNINNVPYYADVSNGVITLDISSLKPDSYAANVSYLGNANFTEFTNKEITFNIGDARNTSTIIANDFTIDEGETALINVTIADATCDVVVIIGDTKYLATLDDHGKATVTVSGLKQGEVKANITYAGDKNYKPANKTVTITVNEVTPPERQNPNLEVSIDDPTITVTINNTATGDVIITVGDISFIQDAQNLKSIDASEYLANGTYDVTVKYAGDNNFANDTKTGSVNVKKEEPQPVEPKDSNLKVNIDGTVITVSINNTATGKIIVTVGDISFVSEAPYLEAIDVSEYLANGTYPVTVEYLGDDVFANDTKTGSVTVPEEPVVELKDSGLKLDIINPVISVSINESATGDVIVTVGDISFIQDAQALTPIDVSEYLTNGTYPVTVKYVGDDVFAEKTLIGGKVTVLAEPIPVLLDCGLKLDIINPVISVSINESATGDVIVTVGDISFIQDAQDLTPIDVSEYLTNGTYTVTVKYVGDDVFAEKTLIGGKVTIPDEPVVEPKDPQLKATASNTTISVSVDKDATGNILVDVGGTGYYAPIKNGQATIKVTGLEPGKYQATVSYPGDDNFKAANTTVTVTVPEEPVVEPEDSNLKVDIDGTVITVSINEAATGDVIVTVGDISFIQDAQDLTPIDVSEYLTNGTYTVTVKYVGDDVFAEKTLIGGKVTIPDEPVVEPKDPQLKATASNTTISVSVDKDATGNILVDVGGTGYYAPIKNGQATIEVTGLEPGKYQATVTYPGDDNFKSAETTVTITVPDEPVVEPKDPNLKATASNTTISVSVDKDATGYVLVDVDGKGYYAPVKDGKATLDLPELDEGEHTVSVTYTGDDKYKPATANKTITVEKEIVTVVTEDLTKVEKGSGSFVANFTDENGNPLANTKVTFEINGGTYTRTTNANGQATFAVNLVAGTYTMVTTNPVTKESATNTITVLPRFTEDSDLVKYFRNDSQYVLKVLDDDGNPVKAGEIVTYNINGVFYNRTTNASGHVKLNINLPPDTYIITAEYKGCKVAHTVKVLQTLTGSDITKKYGQAGAYEAKLVDGQGKAYANQKIEFNINGVMYQRTTNADGVAKLNINLQAGKYIITASYGQARISNTVTVTA